MLPMFPVRISFVSHGWTFQIHEQKPEEPLKTQEELVMECGLRGLEVEALPESKTKLKTRPQIIMIIQQDVEVRAPQLEKGRPLSTQPTSSDLQMCGTSQPDIWAVFDGNWEVSIQLEARLVGIAIGRFELWSGHSRAK